MLKKSVSYTDFDDKPQTEVLHFNLTKVELADNLAMQKEAEDLMEMFSGDPRTLTVTEVSFLLEFIKKLAKISYGVRDGVRFIKNDQTWTEFTQTAIYDAFLTSLFEDPPSAVEFMLGILPKDLREQVETDPDVVAARAGATQELQTTTEPAQPVDTVDTSTSTRLTYNDYTREELLALTDEQFFTLVPPNAMEMTPDQMSVAMERKNNKQK